MGLPRPGPPPRYLRVGTLRLSYRDAGEGPPVLLLHGLGHSADAWRKVIGPLAAEGYRATVPELPGFGWSDPPPRLDLEAYVATLVDWLDLHCFDRVAVVGNSMGGLIAAGLAAAAVGRVATLVLVDPAGYSRPVPWAGRIASLLPPKVLLPRHVDPRRIRHALRWVYADPRLIEEEEVAHIAATLQRAEVRETLVRIARRGVGLRGMRQALGLGRLPEPVSVPTLVMWGDRDRLVPLSHLEAVRARYPHAEVAVFPGCGHCPQLEVPDHFCQRLTRFFRESADYPPWAGGQGEQPA